MLRGSLSSVGCLLFAACSSTHGAGQPPGDQIFTDGSRLVARTYSAPGTQPLFAGIYDRVERTTCRFMTATDGKQRCVPEGATPAGPVSRWVEGVPMPGPSAAGRLQRHDVVTADGGRFPSSWTLYDSRYGAPCNPSVVANDEGTADGRCLPSHAVITGLFFADAGCATSLALIYGDEQPLMVADASQTLFAVAGAWQGPIYGGWTAACAEVPSSDLRHFAVGEQLPADAVAAVRIVPQGTGRLGVQMVEEAGEPLTTVRFTESSHPSSLDGGPYFDRELGLACRPLWTVGQQVRCLPADSVFVPGNEEPLFADPRCTQRVINGAARFAVMLQQDLVTGREVGFEVRELDAAFTGTAYRRDGNACVDSVFLKGTGRQLGEVQQMTFYATLEARTGEEP